MNRLSYAFILCMNIILISYASSSPYPGIPDEEWQKIVPHLVTDSHPVKEVLDNIFQDHRNSVYDVRALVDIGFTYPKIKGQHVHTLFHEKLPGYLIKVYRSKYPGFEPPDTDWQSWLIRIEGAELLFKEINRKKYTNFFSVPKKWIYALPLDHTKKKPINFILVVEDMNLVSKEKNLNYYKKRISQQHLKRIFHLVTKTGLSDGCSHRNLFWTKEKKLAFVDTESHHSWPVHYQRMIEYLNQPMRRWWSNYVRSKGHDPSY